ncbi:MAG: TerB N-terminal domain-containing protein, partial [Abditibacteriota bacterium]|nr:TerB N-terminal domain-containing protein [Abditibacteriota bacterium]
MRISDLTDYAAQKYHIREDVKWDGVPGFSVLAHPDTGKWIAVFIRRRDGRTGAEVVSCDLKCNADALSSEEKELFSLPERASGNKWISIPLDDSTDKDTVFRLLDKALVSRPGHGSTVVIDHRTASRKYSDIPIPFADSTLAASSGARKAVPDRIREMRRIAVLDRSPSGKAERFYRQAVFMKDYEDDCPWEGAFSHYYPTYNDMTDRQLRGYFTWRAAVRRGIYDSIPESAAFLYVYELLNGVGGDTPEDCYRRLLEFKARFVEGGNGSCSMHLNLRRWVWEYAVIHGIAPDTEYPFSQEDDLHLAALSSPETHSDEEVFAALVNFGGKRYESSPAALFPEKGRRLFCQVWRKACAGQEPLKDAFTVCFGTRRPVRWMPLENALYYPMSEVPEDRRKKGWSVSLKGGVSREYPSDVPDMEYT